MGVEKRGYNNHKRSGKPEEDEKWKDNDDDKTTA
jgi:hypothetical protein